MQEVLQQLLDWRTENRFIVPEDWESRGLNPSPPDVVEGMRVEVIKFIDFIISNLKSGNTSPDVLTVCIQNYLDEADFLYQFDTEENEWIFDEVCPIIEKVGVNRNDLWV